MMAPVVLASIVVLFCSFPSLGQQETRIPGPPDNCISESPYTKDSPSPETEVLEACESWQSNSCCTAETARSINRTGLLGLYNFTWDLCGPLSEECRAFMQVGMIYNVMIMQLVWSLACVRLYACNFPVAIKIH